MVYFIYTSEAFLQSRELLKLLLSTRTSKGYLKGIVLKQ